MLYAKPVIALVIIAAGLYTLRLGLKVMVLLGENAAHQEKVALERGEFDYEYEGGSLGCILPIIAFSLIGYGISLGYPAVRALFHR